VLLITAAWERADERVPPWERSEKRQRWARRWWVSNEVLIEAAEKRQELLASLSPAMKEEGEALHRASAARPRTFCHHQGLRPRRASAARARTNGSRSQNESCSTMDQGLETNDQGSPVEVRQPRERITAGLEDDHLTRPIASTVVALRRREVRDDNRISNLVALAEWGHPIAWCRPGDRSAGRYANGGAHSP
jgi:hypothetical protein